MDSKILLESFLNAIDIGAVLESLNNYRNRTWEVSLGKIIRYKIFGKGHTNLTPPQASLLLLQNKNSEDIPIIDLRETEAYEKNHIPGSISKPIDDFLKDIYNGKYAAEPTDKKTILVCDTGQLSEMAAAIMAEEGFTQVYNIKGGMRRWNRWMKLSQKAVITKIASCCTQIP